MRAWNGPKVDSKQNFRDKYSVFDLNHAVSSPKKKIKQKIEMHHTKCTRVLLKRGTENGMERETE